MCKTDRTDCCNSASGNALGEWKYPNGTLVGLRGGSDDFYRNRGSRIVRLNRRNGATGPTGLYCCEVASVADSNARICINLGKITEAC